MTAPAELTRLGLTEADLDMSDRIPQQQGTLDQVDLATFRAVLGSLAAGVTVVTSLAEEGAPRGLTCTAVCSVSASPPLLLVCVKQHSSTLAAIHHSGVFAVNILAAGATDLATTFASNVPERFAGIDWSPGLRTGAPLLARTTARAECVVTASQLMGDHQVVVGRLVHGEALTGRQPLAYWRSQFSEVLPTPA